MNYQPERWLIIKINGDDPHYRVLGSWYGGYLDGDSWRMNSGIVRCEEEGELVHFYGASGSKYSCNKNSYGGHGTALEVAQQAVDGIGAEILSDQDWTDTDWIIGS